jgi:hypothetical protein
MTATGTAAAAIGHTAATVTDATNAAAATACGAVTGADATMTGDMRATVVTTTEAATRVAVAIVATAATTATTDGARRRPGTTPDRNERGRQPLRSSATCWRARTDIASVISPRATIAMTSSNGTQCAVRSASVPSSAASPWTRSVAT